MIDFLDVLAGLFCYVLAFSLVSYHIFAGCLFRWFAKSVISRCVSDVLSLWTWHLACCRVFGLNDFAFFLCMFFLPLDVFLNCSGSNSVKARCRFLTLYLSWPFVSCWLRNVPFRRGQMRKRMRDFLRLRPTDCVFPAGFKSTPKWEFRTCIFFRDVFGHFFFYYGALTKKKI